MKYKKGEFIVVPNIMALKGKPSEMQTIFMWIVQHANEKGQCYPGRRTLAKESGCSLKTLDKYLSQLEQNGFIKKQAQSSENGAQTSNLYQILFVTMEEQKYSEGDSNNTTASHSESATQTIPSINYIHLTKDTDVPSDALSEDADSLNKLPLKYGKSSLIRLLKVYNALWRQRYGAYPVQTNIGRFGKSINKVLETCTEIQTAVLIHTFFHWHGGSGTDQRENTFLSDAGFPVEMLVKKVDIMIAYLTNNIGLEYNSPDKVKSYAVKNLKEIL